MILVVKFWFCNYDLGYILIFDVFFCYKNGWFLVVYDDGIINGILNVWSFDSKLIWLFLLEL